MSSENRVMEIIKPALDRYGDEFSAHGHNYSEGGCRCGWQPRESAPSKRRSTGLHITAARKRASKIYDREVDELLAEARKNRRFL